ncbi:MAG: 50S ribosomal protein L10 [Anaerolineales bacterium]|nr:50S ribosomal protein L10 [Anaerolineales bacterium]
MAISRQRKEELVAHYVDWLNRSQALLLTQYTGLTMKQIDELRGKVREAGGEFHIVKNTLGKVAFEQAGLEFPEQFLDGSTAIVFAFRDVTEMVKLVTEYARTSEFIKIKGGILDRRPVSPADIKMLAELPPLPVMRAQLLGTIMAPASKLARTLAEPARQLAAVFQSYVDKDATPTAA